MQSLKGNFDDSEQDTKGGEKSPGTLPVLLMTVHAPLEFSQTPAVAITDQAGHLRLKHAQIAEYLSFEFIHHPHPVSYTRPSCPAGLSLHTLKGRFMNRAIENSE